MFAAWGRLVHRRRRLVLAGSAGLLVLSIAGMLGGGTLSSGNSATSGLEAAHADALINQQLTAGQVQGSSFLLIFSSTTQHVSDPAFKAAVDNAIAPLRGAPGVTGIQSPYTVAAAGAAAFISNDAHEALVHVAISDTGNKAASDYNDLRARVRSATLSITGTGNIPINHAYNTTLESDLNRAEVVSLPVTLILLAMIFGSLVAAGLPLGIGIITILAGIGGTFALTHFTDVSQYALNIVTLIGIGVAIDYSLIVVSRFRDELESGASREDALATTMATAGRAITFSGLTVAVGLSTMLFYQGTFLGSMGAAGAIVVAAAVVYGLTMLPALLAILGPRVNRFTLPVAGRRGVTGRGLWHSIATWVMRRPVVILVPTIGALLLMGTPFLHLRLANGGVDALPPGLEARQGYDDLLKSFPGQDQTSFDVVIEYTDGNPLTAGRIADQYDLARSIGKLPGVLRVDSIYSAVKGAALSDYQRLYAGGAASLPTKDQSAFRQQVGSSIVRLTAVSNDPSDSNAARNVLAEIRSQRVGNGGEVLVTGDTAFDVDIINFIVGRTPLAVGSVIALTYLLLFVMTGSVVLPLKAVILNLVSVSASFGALVWIFQDGHFATLLNFTPQSIDPSVPVIMFAIVFGISMDYEVLLVSRIQEEYLRAGDNTRAVANGLERTGRMITGAAAIMVAVFMAFGLAEVVIIKAIGLGLAIAVAVDATIVRALIVPAVMRLMGDFNWWAPHWLQRFHLRAGPPVATVSVSQARGVAGAE